MKLFVRICDIASISLVVVAVALLALHFATAAFAFPPMCFFTMLYCGFVLNCVPRRIVRAIERS